MRLPRFARSLVLASTAAWSLAGVARAADPARLEAPRRAAGGGVVEVAPQPDKAEKEKRSKALVEQKSLAIVEASGAEEDPQDPRVRMMLLTAGGPLLVETSITIDGLPFRSIREKVIDEMIVAADSDKDGKPTWSEAIDSHLFLEGRMRVRGNEQQKARMLKGYVKAYDTNSNGVVDRSEARMALGQAYGGYAFKLQPNVSNGIEKFDVRELLDTDKDGALSHEELAAAGARLKSRDANDNDVIELSEIGGAAVNRYQLQALGGQQVQPGQVAFVLGAGAKPDVLFEILKKKYSGDKGFTAARCPLVPNLIESLDTNKNGQWDPEEAAGLLSAPAHVVLEINFGRTGDLPLGLTLKSLAEELGSIEKLVAKSRDVAGDVTVVTLPGLKLELFANTQQHAFANSEASARQMVTRFDADKNGYLEKKEFGDQKGYVQQFDGMDLDSDGKVFVAEIVAFAEKQSAPPLSQINAAAEEMGNTIFSSLDASGDGRLSLREMRLAGERMKKLDANLDGKITYAEIPATLSLEFGRGAYGYGRSVSVGPPAVLPKGAAAPAAGPAWFARMDRNGDGDVTPREFLGTSEQFQKLDIDGDGFVTKEEAQAADKGAESKPELKQPQPEKQTQPAPAS